MSMPFVIIPPTGTEQADEWVKLGVTAHVQGNLPQAQQHYQQALRIDPANAMATQNLAIVFAQSNLMNEAMLTIERAAMFDGMQSEVLTNWALMALAADQIAAALSAARSAYEMKPNQQTRLALAMVYATAGMPELALPIYEQMLAEEPAHPVAGANACFVQTLMTCTPKELREKRQGWYEANRFKGPRAPHQNDKHPDRPLRIGYVSGDFKMHSASMIFKGPVLRPSDGLQTYLYSTLPVDIEKDQSTKEFHAFAGARWRDVTALSDEQLDAQIRQDQIDILVDLAGHTNGGRLTIFTRKPAPIQVTAWGFAHGTGCPEIDYFFADPVAIRPDEREHYVEQIVDLPCIVSYSPPPYDVKGTSTLPYFKNEFITFGSYARYEKMNEECLLMFAEILRQVPDSRLEFKDHGCRRPYSIKRIRGIMADIDPKRLLFSIATSHPEHMQAYQQADLILDPFPHSGGVVCLEQLYMGVPMITRYGTQASGRTSSSVLTTMGRTEWIAHSKEQYVEKAVAMANDVKTLSRVRKTLRQQFMDSPVVQGYPEKVEAAYRAMWRRYCGT